MKRALFILRDLPRATLSLQRLFAGEEALSGTHSSTLAVAEGLSRRGWEVGMLIAKGGSLTDTSIVSFDSFDSAAAWARGAHTVWSYYGDDAIIERLDSLGIRPLLWSHIHVPGIVRDWLKHGKIKGLLTVSDTARLTLLRSNAHHRIGRVYNALAPVFQNAGEATADRYRAGAIIYAGYLNVSKGAHRLLQMWPGVRRLEPAAELLLAGSERLYGSGRDLGPSGLASPSFEAQYLAPIIAEFGSLESAGLRPAGLLAPIELRELYLRCRVGIVNPNCHEYTETFCCSAVEMLATGLPVFGVARGALPETIGATGGAWLSHQEDLEQNARELVALLRDPSRLAALGAAGKEFVRQHYALAHVVDVWERIFKDPEQIELETGAWRGPITPRYRIEKWAGKLGMESLLNTAAHAARALRGHD